MAEAAALMAKESETLVCRCGPVALLNSNRGLCHNKGITDWYKKIVHFLFRGKGNLSQFLFLSLNLSSCILSSTH